MKKVALLIYSSPFHFPPTINAANLLSERGVEVHLIGYHIQDNWSQQLNPEVKLVYLGEQETGVKGVLQYFRSIIFLRRYLKQHQVSSLLGYDAKSVLPAFLATRRRPVRWFFHQHDFWEKPKGAWERFIWQTERKLIRYASSVTFPQSERAELFKEVAGLKRMPRIIFNAPRVSWLKKSDSPHPLVSGLRGKFDYLLLYQGGWSKHFGIERLFHALAQCETNTALIMLGEEREAGVRKKFEQILRDLRLTEKVFLADKYIPYDELPKVTMFCDAAVAILTRENDHAPFNNRFLIGASNKISEYVACGLPVIAEDSNVNRRFFKEYPIGILVDSGNPESFAASIDRLLTDSKKREQFADNNRRLFASKLNFDSQFSELRDMLLDSSCT